jgi:hypothetical protein
MKEEARGRFGPESANELGASVASSIPEQLPGREPASARKGYEGCSRFAESTCRRIVWTSWCCPRSNAVRCRMIIALAARHAIPVIYEWRDFVVLGGLASYGTSLADGYRQDRQTTGSIFHIVHSAMLRGYLPNENQPSTSPGWVGLGTRLLIKSHGVTFPLQPQHPIDCAQYILFATPCGLKPGRIEKNARFVSKNYL